MQKVILSTINDSEGAGYALMSDLFVVLCFCHNFHGEVEDGAGRCIIDCNHETAYNEALELQCKDGLHYDINCLVIEEVDA